MSPSLLILLIAGAALSTSDSVSDVTSSQNQLVLLQREAHIRYNHTSNQTNAKPLREYIEVAAEKFDKGVKKGKDPRALWRHYTRSLFGASPSHRRNKTKEDRYAIKAGDLVSIKGNTGVQVEVDGNTVWARSTKLGGHPGLLIEKEKDDKDSFIMSGDTVYLGTHTGHFLEVDGAAVQARWKDKGDWQAITIEKVRGDGIIHNTDEITLKAHTGQFLTVAKEMVQALNDHENFATCTFTISRLPFGSLHHVVGTDGVLMISGMKGQGQDLQNNRSLEALKLAKIFPTKFPVTDARVASTDQLSLSCPLESPKTEKWCDTMGRKGLKGCKSSTEQAITDSHRRALAAAMKRDTSSRWTAIFEDDVVPFKPELFDDEFREAWGNIPSNARIVRLGWCTFEKNVGQVFDKPEWEGEEFKIVKERWWEKQGARHYYTGGCTTGYLVHQEIIPEIMQLFPCCCPIDCCLQHGLFYKPVENIEDAAGAFAIWRGPEIMVDLDAKNSRKFSKGFTAFNQSGIVFQDNRVLRKNI